MKIGIIDLGSNTIRLVIYRWDGVSLLKMHNVKRKGQAAKYISDGELTKVGIENIIEHLKELLVIARSMDVQEIRIFATASLRNIKNSASVQIQIERAVQRKIDILDGDEESLFGFEGMKRTFELPLEGLSIDVGGASTEITHFYHGGAVSSISIPIGSLNLYLNHVHDVLPSPAEVSMMRIDIQQALQNIAWIQKLQIKEVIGIGGSSRAMMRLHQLKHDIQSSIFDMHLASELIKSYIGEASTQPDALIQLISEHLLERLSTVIPGMIIIDEVMSTVKAEQFRLSADGVREGYFYKRILKQ
jgi:exopolyphosphatase / guanosine-5'-triphosphate,3'-diphosphate pyrophosphatase